MLWIRRNSENRTPDLGIARHGIAPGKLGQVFQQFRKITVDPWTDFNAHARFVVAVLAARRIWRCAVPRHGGESSLHTSVEFCKGEIVASNAVRFRFCDEPVIIDPIIRILQSVEHIERIHRIVYCGIIGCGARTLWRRVMGEMRHENTRCQAYSGCAEIYARQMARVNVHFRTRQGRTSDAY